MQIGYIKLDKYIIEIEVYNNNINNINNINEDYTTSNYKINKITDVVGNKYKHIQYRHNEYKIDNIYNEHYYYLTYERAFLENFIYKKQYELFPNGYSGITYTT